VTGYDVGDHLPVETVPEGTNLLVAGPPLTGKRELARSLLADGCERDEGAVVVGTRDSVKSLKRQTPAVWDAVQAGRGGIVDCVTRQGGETVEDEELVKYVPSPGDVTEIGIRLGGIFQHLEREGVRTRFAVSTVSTMLMYADVRRVYRFLHVYAGHVERLDWLGIGVLDSSNRDTFDRLAPLYDGMVQTRRSDDGTQLRVVGLGRGRTDWVDY
jgi:KaiC/GvpD/RAD55 family RecA-like ATPase